MHPVFHPRTKLKLDNYLKKPSHALLLIGTEGSGKRYLAEWLALNLQAPPLIVEPPEEKTAITIEQIRELYNLTRSGANLVVILKDSHTMSTEAQNAFLKLLEEPPGEVNFILTADNPKLLLPTIHSRSQSIEVLPVPRRELQKHIETTLSPQQVASLMHTSGGKAGVFFTLLNKSAEHESHQSAVAGAKEFYSASPYERHLLCIQQGYEKQWTEQLFELLALIIRTLLKQAGNNRQALSKLLAQSELIERTSHNLLKINGNPKIHLAKLCEQL